MKKISSFLAFSLFFTASVCAQDETTYIIKDESAYTNFVVQRQLCNPPVVSYLNHIASTGEENSPLQIEKEGAEFELWTVTSTPLNSHLLQKTYVGAFAPVASVVIDTEDPWNKDPESVSYANPTFATDKVIPKNSPAGVRRTRADRPFKVYIFTDGLKDMIPTAPEASKKLDLYQHHQSYGAGGTGEGLNRSQSILAQAFPQVITNGVQNPITINCSTIPGSDRTKLRGEETFSIWSLKDTSNPSQPVPSYKLSSDYVKIWPMSDGSLSGIKKDDTISLSMPPVTFRYGETYPGSETFAQVYKGELSDNVEGQIQIIPGSHKNNTSEVPENYIETTGSDFNALFTSEGRWTIEILTVTPFDTIRLAHVSFTLDRTLKVNSTMTTIE